MAVANAVLLHGEEKKPLVEVGEPAATDTTPLLINSPDGVTLKRGEWGWGSSQVFF